MSHGAAIEQRNWKPIQKLKIDTFFFLYCSRHMNRVSVSLSLYLSLCVEIILDENHLVFGFTVKKIHKSIDARINQYFQLDYSRIQSIDSVNLFTSEIHSIHLTDNN